MSLRFPIIRDDAGELSVHGSLEHWLAALKKRPLAPSTRAYDAEGRLLRLLDKETPAAAEETPGHVGDLRVALISWIEAMEDAPDSRLQEIGLPDLIRRAARLRSGWSPPRPAFNPKIFALYLMLMLGLLMLGLMFVLVR